MPLPAGRNGEKAPVPELSVRSGDLVWEAQSSAQKALFECARGCGERFGNSRGSSGESPADVSVSRGCEPKPVHPGVVSTSLLEAH